MGQRVRLLCKSLLLVLFTSVRTATPVTFFFALPFIAECVPNFPNVSIVSAVVSVARLLSTAIVALFPSHLLTILAALSSLASMSGAASEFFPLFNPSLQGYYLFGWSVLIFFCSGSSIARGLIVTEDDSEGMNLLSYVYTGAKESVYLLSFLLSMFILSIHCWDGFGFWVAGSYFVMCSTSIALILVRSKSQYWGSLFDTTESPDGNTFVYTGGNSKKSGQNPALRVILSTVKDIRDVPLPVWAFIQCEESINLTGGILSLSAVMFVKKQWALSSQQAAAFTLFPQALALPLFFMLSFVRGDGFIKIIVCILVNCVVGVIPFMEEPVLVGLCVLVCELANAVRLAEVTPLLSQFMQSKCLTIRVVSIVTIFAFIYKTLGLSVGSYLFTLWRPLPFIVCAAIQFINALGLVALKYFYGKTILSSDEVHYEKANLLG